MGFCCNRGYSYAMPMPVGGGGNMFVLIVVLFILLIIVGAAWVY